MQKFYLFLIALDLSGKFHLKNLSKMPLMVSERDISKIKKNVMFSSYST
jgi:hypothetical protein